MEQVNKRYREEFDTKEKYDRYRMKSIEDKQEEIIDWINEHEKYTEPLERAWRQAIEQLVEQAKKGGSAKNGLK